MTVFVDTSGWLSVLVSADRFHRAGSDYFQSLIARNATAITSDFVLDEAITRLRYDIDHRAAAVFLTLIHRAVDDQILAVHRISPDLWMEAEAIFLRYHDARLSFTDCTSVAFLQTRPVDEVFGFDAHFEMMGHILKPKP